MIRLCDACRNALCSTLEFLSQVKESELLEPMMPTIRTCLEDIDLSVRQCAVDAISTICKNFDFLIPDYIELITSFNDREQGKGCNCKWEAFMMLYHTNRERALSYLSTCKEFYSFGIIRQLDIVATIDNVCRQNPSEKSRFIPCMYILLKCSCTAVKYEAARTLVSLTDETDAVKTAISAYISIIVEDIYYDDLDDVLDEALERLVDMSHSSVYKKILAEQVVDILRVLSIPGRFFNIKMKILSLLAMDLVTSRDMKEVVLVIKEEINKTSTSNKGDISQYGQFLDNTLQCALKSHTEKIKKKMKTYREKDEKNKMIFAEQKEKITRLEERNTSLEEKNTSLEEKNISVEEKNTTLQEENAALQEKSACKICFRKDVKMIFLPCGHLTCELCGHRISHCHICRELIQKRHTIYLS